VGSSLHAILARGRGGVRHRHAEQSNAALFNAYQSAQASSMSVSSTSLIRSCCATAGAHRISARRKRRGRRRRSGGGVPRA